MKFLLLIFLLFSSNALADNLICEGDSQTAVRSPLTDAQTWCSIVANKLGYTHSNFAVGGSTTADVKARLATDLATSGSCVVVMIGANNAFIPTTTTVNNSVEWSSPVIPPSPGTSLATYKSDLTDIIDTIRASGKSVTLVTPWAFFATAEMVQFPFYVRTMQDVGAVKGVPVLDAYHIQIDLWWNLNSNLWSKYEADYQHPNANGHSKIAELFSQERYKDSCAYKGN